MASHSFSELITEFTTQVKTEEESGGKRSPLQILHCLVGKVPTENLGGLILEAEKFVSPYRVKCRYGFTSRYPDSWEQYLRETLESAIIVFLSLD